MKEQVEGKWKQLRGSVKQKWAKLTDSDWTTSQASAMSLRANYKSGMV